MEQKKLAGIKISNIIYLSVIIVFLIAVALSFFYSTNFILKNINKIFSPGEDQVTKALELANYTLIAKKLNLSTTTKESGSMVDTPPSETSTTTDTLDKKIITIRVLNGTEKPGLASSLAGLLEETGLPKASTGNEDTLYELTTIIIRNNKKEYISIIEEAVKQAYPEAVTQVTTDELEFDVTIIIGEK